MTADNDRDNPTHDGRRAALGRAIPDGGTERSDAGSADEMPFEVVSEYEETRRDRLAKLYDVYLHTPVAIVRTDWRAIFGFTIVGIYVLTAIIAPETVQPPASGQGEPYLAPFQDWSLPLGTDNFGRDLFAQTVLSTRPVLIMMASGAVWTAGMGLVIGAVAGYKGGTVDTILSTITDVFINIPGLPFVMVLTVLLEEYILGNFIFIGVVLSIAAWSGLARAIRSQMLTLRQESFTEAARAMGMPTRSILYRDIIPHLMPYVTINLTNAARRVIFSAVAIYYLGLLPYTTANWGITLSAAYNAGAFYRATALHWFIVPMVAIALISVGLILLGQSLDRVFNPRVRARHAERVDTDELEAGGDEGPSLGMTGGGV